MNTLRYCMDTKEMSYFFVHWGKKWTCTFQEFYESSLVLLQERKTEQYINVKHSTVNRYTYDLIKENTKPQNLENVRSSICPAVNTGFRAQLLHVFVPESIEHFKRYRNTFLSGTNTLYRPPDVPRRALSFVPRFDPSHTIKHMAQVFLDGEINGAPFEGESVWSVLSFLYDFLLQLESRHPTQNHDTWNTFIHSCLQPVRAVHKNALSALKEHIETVCDFEIKKNAIIAQYKNTIMDRELLEQVVEKDLYRMVNEYLDEFKTRNDLFVSGGFSGQPSHTLIYRFNRFKNTVYFCVYDSSNSEFHEITTHTSHLFYPAYVIKMPESLDHLSLTQFLVALFQLEILPQINARFFSYTERDLYKILHSAPTGLHGSVYPAEKCAHPISPQRSGTCVWKSIEQLIAAVLHTHSPSFLLAYQLYCFDRLNGQQIVFSSGAIKTLKRSLVVLSRTMNEAQRTYNWPEPDVAHFLAQMQSWKGKWNRMRTPKINQRVVLPQYGVDAPITSHLIQSSLTEFTVKPELNEVPCPERIPMYGPHNQKIDEALYSLNQLMHEPNWIVSERIQCLEKFCIHFSDLRTDLTCAQPIEKMADQKKLIETFSKIVDTYHHIEPQLTPHGVIIHLSLMSLIDRLGEKKIFHFGAEALSGFSLYGAPLRDLVNRLSSNPFLSTFDPRLDHVWVHIRQWYKNHSFSHTPIEHYSRLCAQSNAEERMALETHWDAISGGQQQSVKLITAIQALFAQHGHPSFYCYLNPEERLKNESKLVELHAAFQVQADIEKFLLSCMRKIAVVPYMNRNDLVSEIPPCDPSDSIQIIPETVFDTKNNESIVVLKVCSIVMPEGEIQKSLFLSRLLLDETEQGPHPIHHVLLRSYDGYTPNSHRIPYERSVFQASKIFIDLKKTIHPLIKNQTADERTINLLHCLRISLSCQVIAILSELCVHPDWLNDEQFERYMVLSVFQPNSLLIALRNSDEMWNILEELWRLHTGHVKTAWRLLKLSVLIGDYATEAIGSGLIPHSEETISHHIPTWRTRLFAHTTDHYTDFNHKNDPKLLREWHYFRLMAFLLPRPVSDSNEQYVCASYWFLTLSKPLLTQRQEAHIQKILAKTTHYFIKISCSDQKIQEETQQLIQKYLGYSCTMRINFQTQSITNDQGQIITFLPKTVCDAPEYLELFRSYHPLTTKQWVTQDAVSCEAYHFTQDARTQRYRILFSDHNTILIFQKWHIDRWYTYAAPSEAMRSFLNFQYCAFACPPALFDQAHLRVWTADPDHWMIVAHTDSETILDERQGSYSTFQTLESHSIVRPLTHQEKVFLRFEHPAFIRVVEKNGQEFLNFERYGMHIINTGSSYQTSDLSYTVAMNVSTDGFGSGLFLQNNSNKSYALRMPIQPYRIALTPDKKPQSTEDQTHYLWVHDLSGEIQKTTLFPEQEKLKSHPGWFYPHSESCVQFDLNDQKEPVAYSSHDQLYLVYLYLAQDRPKQALACMRTCILQGTFLEVERLWWILTKLPEKTQFTIRNSRLLGVQLLAAYALLKSTQNAHWNVMNAPDTPAIPSNTQRYRAHVQTQLT